MNLFDESIKKIRQAIQKNEYGPVNSYLSDHLPDWPPAGNRDIVLKSNTHTELGSPDSESFSMVLWTNKADLISDGKIHILGADINESEQQKRPFGKIILIGGHDFDETNSYDRYRELSLIPYDISLKGYMLRRTSHYMHEWIRISTEAAEKKFSFSIAGKAHIDAYRKTDYVTATEIIMVTENPETVANLRKTCETSFQVINAMRKMAEEMTFDCDTCEYQDVCGEVEALKAMMEEMEKRKTA